MTPQEIRLELLKLTYIHSKGAVEAVAQAKEMEVFVVGEAAGGSQGSKPEANPTTDTDPFAGTSKPSGNTLTLKKNR